MIYLFLFYLTIFFKIDAYLFLMRKEKWVLISVDGKDLREFGEVIYYQNIIRTWEIFRNFA